MNICGTCKKEYKTHSGYLKHTCNKTGHKPNTVEHLDATSGDRFSLQSQKALKRGKDKK